MWTEEWYSDALQLADQVARKFGERCRWQANELAVARFQWRRSLAEAEGYWDQDDQTKKSHIFSVAPKTLRWD